MKKEDKSLIDVENVETTGERCCHLSWRTPLNSSLCMFIGTKHISPTFLCIIPSEFEADNIYKNPPQMSFPLKKNLFFFTLTMPLLTAGALTDPPSAHNSFKRVHDWCKAGWRRPGPPNKNPGYAGDDDKWWWFVNTYISQMHKMYDLHWSNAKYINPSRETIPLIRPHQCQCDSEGGRT